MSGILFCLIQRRAGRAGSKEYVSGSSKVPSRSVKMTSLGVVVVNGILQPLQKVRDGGSHPTPVGDERNPERILHKSFARQFNTLGEGFHSSSFFMTVKIEAIDRRIVMIFGDRLLADSQIS